MDSDHAVSDHATVVRDGKIYVFGGYNDDYSEVKTRTFSIDTRASGAIEELASMPTKRGDLSAVYYNHGGYDHAFLIGGFTDANNYCAPLATVEVYNFNSKTWDVATTTNDLDNERGDKVAVVLDGKILAIGGEDKHEDTCDGVDLDPFTQGTVVVDEIESWDPRSAAGWQDETDLPEIRFRSAGAVDERSNTLYFFGGQKAFDQTCNCYKTADDIYVIVGEQSSGVSNTAIALATSGTVAVVALAALLCVRRKRGRAKMETAPDAGKAVAGGPGANGEWNDVA